MTAADPFLLPDLASRPFGGSVPYANDELFADSDNLIAAHEPEFVPATFGARGQIYDGWETRRRREAGHDEAIVRLGVPGLVRGVDIDTAHFIGNYPPFAELHGVAMPGYPDVPTLRAAPWRELVGRSPLQGGAHNRFVVDAAAGGDLVTHVRLRIHPDGGVARLRVHGEPLIDPRFIDVAPFDLAALEHGGLVTAASNEFFSSPSNLLMPGPARTMGEGWETARRRDDGHDWVELRLATTGVVRLLELDLTHFVGNAPGRCRVLGRLPGEPWAPILHERAMLPGVRHRLLADELRDVAELRLEVFPDGGMARLRAFGVPSPEGREELARRWLDAFPAGASGWGSAR